MQMSNELEYNSAAYYMAQRDENVRDYLEKYQEMELLDVTLRGFNEQKAKMRDELLILFKEMIHVDVRYKEELVKAATAELEKAAAAELEKAAAAELEKAATFELEKQAFAHRAKQFRDEKKRAEQKELEEYVFV
jgi:hypothetical protein